MESCLKENTGIFRTFGTDAGSGFGGSKAGLGGSGDMAAGVVAVSSSAGTTLLTTLRTTFTTFLRVPPCKSSVSSGWLALAVVLTLPLRVPFILLSPFCKGSGLKELGEAQGFWSAPASLALQRTFWLPSCLCWVRGFWLAWSEVGTGSLWVCPKQAEDFWHAAGLCQAPGWARTGSGYSGCLRCQTTHPAGTVDVEKSVRKDHWKEL